MAFPHASVISGACFIWWWVFVLYRGNPIYRVIFLTASNPSSPHLLIERLEELVERTSLEESGWCQRER